MNEKDVKLRSLIKTYFSDELYFELMKVTMMYDINNNQKGDEIKKLLTMFEVPYTSLGSGTNRMAVLIEGYAVKIALDSDGMIDNRREMLYTKNLQPYVVRVYECVPNGLIAVSEYVTIFNLDDYRSHQDEMRDILEAISKKFLIGDVGITPRNYVNWGLRSDGSICMLDYAYIYSVQYKLFVCSCDGMTMVQYDDDYVGLKCPRCGRRYSFGEIRKKVTRESQEQEIGDIHRLGYNLHKSTEKLPVNPEFKVDDFNEDTKKNKPETEVERAIREYKTKSGRFEENPWDDPMSIFEKDK